MITRLHAFFKDGTEQDIVVPEATPIQEQIQADVEKVLAEPVDVPVEVAPTEPIDVPAVEVPSEPVVEPAA